MSVAEANSAIAESEDILSLVGYSVDPFDGTPSCREVDDRISVVRDAREEVSIQRDKERLNELLDKLYELK